MKLGEMITGTVTGIPVAGFWEGRGIYVTDIDDGKPEDIWFGVGEHLYRGRIGAQLETGVTPVIQIGGTYLLDEDI